ncbi:type II secretion system protein N [Celerinatantimonas yamalensis]|uniref:Type II secretion system protein N n=1 Tax=Celerinatantimonas yamalensis TaxID=559956 RepID=A0ABW9G7G2_9GAMM
MSIKYRWVLTGFGFTIYLLSLLMSMPAQQLLGRVHLPGVQWGDAKGTILMGQLNQVRWQGWQLQSVRWQWHPWALFLGHVSLHLQFEGDLNGQTDVRASPWQLTLRDLHLSGQAQRFYQAANIPLPIQLSGTVQLHIQQFRSGQPWCQVLSGSLHWSQGIFRSPLGALHFAPFKAQLSCQNGQIVAHLNHHDKVLSLWANASLKASQWQLQGTLKPEADYPKSYSQVLPQLGAPDAKGNYAFSSSGRLSD